MSLSVENLAAVGITPLQVLEAMARCGVTEAIAALAVMDWRAAQNAPEPRSDLGDEQ